jgi:hypothetical protein
MTGTILGGWSRTAIALIALIGGSVVDPSAWAQQAAGISGVVRDTSNAVMPGVTVEAASPALIERVRTVFTDGEGRYNIVDLRPGIYRVTFTFTGFSTIVREGIELPSGFTASVNATMTVGSLSETLTVRRRAFCSEVRDEPFTCVRNCVLVGWYHARVGSRHVPLIRGASRTSDDANPAVSFKERCGDEGSACSQLRGDVDGRPRAVPGADAVRARRAGA